MEKWQLNYKIGYNNYLYLAMHLALYSSVYSAEQYIMPTMHNSSVRRIVIFCLKIGRDGNCMVNSVLSQLEIKDEEDVVLCTSMYIRRMDARHFLEHYEQLKENISFGIEQYGRIDCSKTY